MNIIKLELSEKTDRANHWLIGQSVTQYALLSTLEKGNLAAAYSGFAVIVREAY